MHYVQAKGDTEGGGGGRRAVIPKSDTVLSTIYILCYKRRRDGDVGRGGGELWQITASRLSITFTH